MSRGQEWNKGAPPSQASAPKPAEGPSPGELSRMARRANEPSPVTTDDSGLIDIRALMAAAQATERPSRPSGSELTPVPTVQSLDIYPFGPPAPPTPPGPPAEAREADKAPPAAPRGKALLFVGAGALVAALALTGVMVLRPRAPAGDPHQASAGDDPARGAAQESALVQTGPQRTGLTPAEEGKKANTGEPNKDSAVAPPAPEKPSKVGAAPGRVPTTGKKPKTDSSQTVPPKGTTPPKNTCRADDLLCHMKQSTGQK